MKDVHSLYGNLLNKVSGYSHQYRPQIFDIGKVDDRVQVEALLKRKTRVLSTIEHQVKELIYCTCIDYEKSDIDYRVRDFLKTKGVCYGSWVYYEWKNELVHLLPENDFIQVRTSRNKYKITPEDQDLLSKKQVGVVGLSVGKSVAIAMALERGFGKIKLADFDTLDLSNFNRLSTSTSNLSLPKVIAVAREIAEIDPYLEVEIFDRGITEDNIDHFLDSLDLVIEECDGLNIKILIRQKCRKKGIPVLMEASDRGMLDIERFDKEINRPILHGLIDHLNLTEVKNAQTNEEKLPFLLPMIGLETITDDLKASMLEINESISTWPQLASSVVLGGGLTADIGRKILLNERVSSGRYYIDLDKLVSKEFDQSEVQLKKLLNRDQHDYKREDISVLVEEGGDQFYTIIEEALNCPSGGNIQPWKFVLERNSITISIDSSRSGYLLDFNRAATYVAFGNLRETLDILLCASGFTFEVTNALREKDFLRFSDIRTVQYSKSQQNEFLKWKNRIQKRRTNRSQPVTFPLQKGFNIELLEVQNSRVHFAKEKETVSKLADILSEAEKIRVLSRNGHEEFIKEVCWSEREYSIRRDGICINSLYLTQVEQVGFELIRSNGVVERLRKWKGGDGLKKISKRRIQGSSAIGVVTVSGLAADHTYFEGGRAILRAWSKINSLGYELCPHTTLLYLNLKDDRIDENVLKTISNLKLEFDQLMGIREKEIPVFVFRMFKSEMNAVKSLRRKLTVEPK